MVVWVGMCLGSRNVSKMTEPVFYGGLWEVLWFSVSCQVYHLLLFNLSLFLPERWLWLCGGMRGSDGAVIWAWTEAAQRQTVNPRPFSLLLLWTYTHTHAHHTTPHHPTHTIPTPKPGSAAVSPHNPGQSVISLSLSLWFCCLFLLQLINFPGWNKALLSWTQYLEYQLYYNVLLCY